MNEQEAYPRRVRNVGAVEGWAIDDHTAKLVCTGCLTEATYETTIENIGAAVAFALKHANCASPTD